MTSLQHLQILQGCFWSFSTTFFTLKHPSHCSGFLALHALLKSSSSLFQKTSVIQRRCGGLHQHSLPLSRLLSSNKPPKGKRSVQCPSSDCLWYNEAKWVHAVTQIFLAGVRQFIIFCSLLNLGFEKFFPKSEESTSRRSVEGEKSVSLLRAAL